MERCRMLQMFVILIFFVAVVHGITRCPAQGPYKSYTCPRLSDPPERTRCCLWNGAACCLPGGSTCSDSAAHIRNYCPGPGDGENDRVCCTVNSKAKCCDVGLVAIISGVLGVLLVVAVVILAVCCFSPKCPLNQYRKRRQTQNAPTFRMPGIPQRSPRYN